MIFFKKCSSKNHVNKAKGLFLGVLGLLAYGSALIASENEASSAVSFFSPQAKPVLTSTLSVPPSSKSEEELKIPLPKKVNGPKTVAQVIQEVKDKAERERIPLLFEDMFKAALDRMNDLRRDPEAGQEFSEGMRHTFQLACGEYEGNGIRQDGPNERESELYARLLSENTLGNPESMMEFYGASFRPDNPNHRELSKIIKEGDSYIPHRGTARIITLLKEKLAKEPTWKRALRAKIREKLPKQALAEFAALATKEGFSEMKGLAYPDLKGITATAIIDRFGKAQVLIGDSRIFISDDSKPEGSTLKQIARSAVNWAVETHGGHGMFSGGTGLMYRPWPSNIMARIEYDTLTIVIPARDYGVIKNTKIEVRFASFDPGVASVRIIRPLTQKVYPPLYIKVPTDEGTIPEDEAEEAVKKAMGLLKWVNEQDGEGSSYWDLRADILT